MDAALVINLGTKFAFITPSVVFRAVGYVLEACLLRFERKKLWRVQR